MVFSIFTLNRIHSKKQFLGGFLIVFGIFIFVETDKKVSSQFSWLGFILCSISLFLNGIHDTSCEKLFSVYDASSVEAVFYKNVFGCFFLFVYVVSYQTTSLQNVYNLLSNDFYLSSQVLTINLLFYLGNYFLTKTLMMTNSTFIVILTSIRKMMTIFISFFIFSKPFTPVHIFGVVMVFSGILFTESFRVVKKKEAILKL
eukprot:TRINITY_DN11392_c0_g1_i1.p1 TRINITY_DN11392_c0_g1~~TRINITY_DN11392_c0_g1_i1.p1  ORF type:complete len:201 (+),score=28.13 TRINITY_DN11392_c0_g1_i1:370-972(+)